MLETQNEELHAKKKGGDGASHDIDVDAELQRFEAEQRKALGIAADHVQWIDRVPQDFTAKQRAHTTILVGGLTMAHDLFIAAALRGLGYKVRPIDVPNQAALSVGKEFGNRGQCNPTYFTVGNLVKELQTMRDEAKMSKDDIVENYLFVTAGACGPCRFGTYVTEYRKALRDAGFEGFRVLLFQQQGGLKQATGEDAGLEMNPKFFIGVLLAILSGDVLNAIGYRIRPYEVEAGATNLALEASKKAISDALEFKSGSFIALAWAIVQARRLLSKVEVDRTRVKPKVSVIGEFWAMTTEGDGNYQLQKFLEAEGAEVDIQLVTAWILFMVWEQRWDTQQRMMLRGEDKARKGLVGVNPQKKLVMLWVAEKAIRGIFHSFASLMGLHDYHLPDMNELADTAAAYYNNHLRGGEGHMEIGKLILNVVHKKATMTLSVKPFGCMPSSGVSDGVASYVTEKWPGTIFCPIETNGDGKVNVYSRIQMQLFKARKVAEAELEQTLAATGMTREEYAKRAASRKWTWSLSYPRHTVAATASNVAYELAPKSVKQRLGGAVSTVKHAADAVRTQAPKTARTLFDLARASLS